MFKLSVYNKDAVIEYLLERSKYESGPDHIKGLKDVKELNLVLFMALVLIKTQ